MDMVFCKLEGLSGIADDTLVYGMGKAQHDQRISNILYAATATMWDTSTHTNFSSR